MKPNNIVNLDKCLDYLQPTPYIVQSTDYMESGDIPVLTPGKTFILGYTNEKTGIFSGPFPVIIFDDFTTASKLVDFPFKVKSSAMKILLPKKDVDIKYIFYFLQVKKFPAQTHKRYWISVCSKTNISLPLLSEQKRIVKKIEELFAAIDKNIQKLEYAQQALIQYRISILHTLLEKSHKKTGNQVPFSTVIKEIIGGGTPSKSNAKYYQGQIPFMTVKDMTSSRPTDTAWHITQDAVTNSSTNIIPANTLIIATRVGLGKVVQMTQPVAINQDLKGLILRKDIINQQFFEYVLHQKKSIILHKSRGTTVKGITLEDFKDIQFFLPSLPAQKAIVEKIEKAFACADKAQAAISAALEQAKQLKQSILKRAFEGCLVPQDPNDKPVDLTQLTPKGKSK